jgi:hypothetical protein
MSGIVGLVLLSGGVWAFNNALFNGEDALGFVSGSDLADA